MASFLDALRGKKQRPQRERRSSGGVTSPQRLADQVHRRVVNAAMESLPPDELARVGRGLLDNLLYPGGDPKQRLVAEELANDPEFRSQVKELYLEEARAEIEAKRAQRHRRDGNEDGGRGSGDDELSEWGRQLLLERLDRGSGDGGVLPELLRALGQVLSPGGALSQILAAQSAQPGYVLPQPAPQRGEILASQEEDKVPSPLLLDIFSAEQVKDLFRMPAAEAAAAAWDAVSAAMEGKTPAQRIRVMGQVQMLLSLPFSAVMVVIEEYRRRSEWEPVVNWLGKNKEWFDHFQAGLAEKAESGDAEGEHGVAE